MWYPHFKLIIGRAVKQKRMENDFATVINEKESQSKERKGVSFVGCE